MEYDKILTRITKSINRVEFVEQRLESFDDKLQVALEKQKTLQDDLYLNSGALEVFSVIIEKVNEANIKGMMKLVNKACSFIFDDRNIDITYKIDEARGHRRFEIYTEEEKDNHLVRVNVRDAEGEGIRVIIGLMIVHFYLKVSESVRLILLDECVTSVADAYIENLFDFLRGIGKQGGFSYVLVSHDPRIATYVDFKYRMQGGRLKQIN